MFSDDADPECRGGPAQIALQRSIFARTAEIVATPGLTHGGRLIGIDDLAGLGDAAVRDVFDETGAVIVKFLPAEEEADFIARFDAPDRAFTAWDVFLGDLRACRRSAKIVADHVLPEGWRLACLDADTPPAVVAEIQAVQEASGVAPVPGYYQRGRAVPAVAAVLSDADGRVVATAQAQQRHHAAGKWAGYVFGGMVAVHPDHRRQGLGTLINAYMVAQSFRDLACDVVYEHARKDNWPSRGMIEACGLQLDDRYRCVMFHDVRRFGPEFTK